MDKLEHLKQVCTRDLIEEKVIMDRFFTEEYSIDHLIISNTYYLRTHRIRSGLFSYFTENNLVATKQHFYKYGRLLEYIWMRVDHFPAHSFLYDLTPILVCDNKKLIEKSSSFSYNNNREGNFMKSVEDGTFTPIYIVQCLLNDNFEEITRVMPIMKAKTIKSSVTLNWDIMFYEGLIERNKDKMEEAILGLLQPKVHNARNKHFPLINQFISNPALSYTKLAWYKGIEVKVDSPLVPKEWLPIQPLKDEEYIDYDFVKQYLG